jgi:hypothetical protein
MRDDCAGLAGGCACGEIRFQLSSTPFEAGYCHCGICRRSSGAPVLAFATVPVADFAITRGTPRRRRSSPFGERWFCGGCGSQIAMHVDHQPDTIDFTIALLDEPARVAPTFHLFFDERVEWFDTGDSLPRHAGFRPDTRGLAREQT